MASDYSASTTKTYGIEHRLYSFEKSNEDHLVLCTPSLASWYALKGYLIFDFTKSLDMEPEYYDKEIYYTL